VDAALEHARTLVTACRSVVDGAARRLAADCAKDGKVDTELMDREQVLAYDLATVAGQGGQSGRTDTARSDTRIW
jgi:(2S)-methylsuccinyl-CoA dehydrogenase